MRILVVSNFYPPYVIGGYELGCRDVVEGLRARGHELRVLTSTYGLQSAQQEALIERTLQVDMGWDFSLPTTGWRLFRKELTNRRALLRALRQFQPDVVYIWSLRYCSVALAMLAQQAGLPTCFYVSDTWLAEWRQRDRWFQQPHQRGRRVFKHLLDRAVAVASAPSGTTLRLRHVQCTSAYIQQATQPAEDARVIPWGIDPARVLARSSQTTRPLRLLYAGQVVAHKGVHTALEACLVLVARGYDLALTIAGALGDAAYAQHLRALAEPLGQRVRFLGGLPRERMPELYAGHDILIFPAVWPEPFSIVLLEALAAGLAVVATATGGTTELLTDGQNALLFRPGDTAACELALERLYHDSALAHTLGQAGRVRVLEHFRLDQMLDAISLHLTEVYHGR